MPSQFRVTVRRRWICGNSRWRMWQGCVSKTTAPQCHKIDFRGHRPARNEVWQNKTGKWIEAVVDVKIEGRTRRNEWEIVTQETRIDLLAREGSALRFARSTPTDKFRLANVSGRTYTDNQAGLSFSVPV